MNRGRKEGAGRISAPSHDHRLLLDDIVGTHHVVVLVLEDVAVPHVLARDVEVRPDVRGLHGIRPNGVFRAFLVGVHWQVPRRVLGKILLWVIRGDERSLAVLANNKGAPPAPLRAAVSAA